MIALRSGSAARQRPSVGQGRLSGIQLPSGRLPTSPGGDDGGVQALGARGPYHRAQGVDPTRHVGDRRGRAFVRRTVTLVLGPESLEGVMGGHRGPPGFRQPRSGGILLGAGGPLGPAQASASSPCQRWVSSSQPRGGPERSACSAATAAAAAACSAALASR